MARSNYKERKAARLAGKPNASRSHESKPWWCGSLSVFEFGAKIAKDAATLNLKGYNAAEVTARH